jgi:uncharacterized protein (DUF3084 family)
MKKFLAILIFLAFTLTSFAQIEYPRFETDSLGTKVVVMTIEQAQKLDNNSELLILFESLNAQIGEYDSVCVKVLNEKDQIINLQTIQISDLKKSLLTKDEKIANLQKSSDEKDTKIVNLNTIITNKDAEINLHLDEMRRVKTKYLIGGGLGGAILGFVLGAILVH